MKKLKRLLNKKSFDVLIIYGPPAVGKFTVAKEISKRTDFKIFHNHSIKDFIWNFFERGTHSDHFLFEKVVLLTFEQIAKNHTNTILTNTHSSNFVSATGLRNVDLYKRIEKIVKKHGGRVSYIQLVAEPKELIKRSSSIDRTSYRKLTDKKIMKTVLGEKDWITPAKLENQIIINNTKVSPKKVADIVIKHFSL